MASPDSEGDRKTVHSLWPKINDEKTRKVHFMQPPHQGDDPVGKSGTFDFLWFTLFWRKTRQGSNIPPAKAAKRRLTRALAELKI